MTTIKQLFNTDVEAYSIEHLSLPEPWYSEVLERHYEEERCIHNDHIISYSIAKDAEDQSASNIRERYSEFKERLIRNSKSIVEDKLKIEAICPTTWYPMAARQSIWDKADEYDRAKILDKNPKFNPTTNKSKSEIFANQRQMICLDFDINPDLDHIKKALSKLVYIGYTTHSHETSGKGERYRFVLPFAQQYTKKEWQEYARATLMKFLKRLLKDGDAVIDSSCNTFRQIAFMPAVNPTNGRCEIFYNDGKGTVLLDIEQMERVVTPIREVIRHNTDISNLTSGINIPLVIQYLSTNPEIAGKLEYNKGENIRITKQSTTRMTIAAALRAIGGSDDDIIELDGHMLIPGTTVSSQKLVKNVLSASLCSPDLILYYLTTPQKIATNLHRIEYAINYNKVDKTEQLLLDRINILKNGVVK